MADPSDKAPEIAKFLDTVTGRIFGRERTSSIEGNICVACGAKAPPESFRDDLSIKEYSISGLCQRCQDSVFEPDQL